MSNPIDKYTKVFRFVKSKHKIKKSAQHLMSGAEIVMFMELDQIALYKPLMVYFLALRFKPISTSFDMIQFSGLPSAL